MCKRYSLLLILMCIKISLMGQTAKLDVTLFNMKGGDKVALILPISTVVQEGFNRKDSLNKNNFKAELQIKEPTFATLIFDNFRLKLLIQPSDDFKLSVDIKNPRNTIQFENSPTNAFYATCLTNPIRKWTATELGNSTLETILMTLSVRDQEIERIKEYNIPKDLQELLRLEINYYFFNQLLGQTEDIYGDMKALYLNELEGFITPDFINNPAALIVPSYNSFLNFYGIHIKQYYGWEYFSNQPENIEEQSSNLRFSNQHAAFLFAFWKEQLSLKVLEKALANLLSRAGMLAADYDKLFEIYQYFEANYPNSIYLNLIKPEVEAFGKFLDLPFEEKDFELIETDFDSLNDFFKAQLGKNHLVLYQFRASGSNPHMTIQLGILRNRLDSLGLSYMYLNNYFPRANGKAQWESYIKKFKQAGRHYLITLQGNFSKELREFFQEKFDQTFPGLFLLNTKGEVLLVDVEKITDAETFINHIKKLIDE